MSPNRTTASRCLRTASWTLAGGWTLALFAAFRPGIFSNDSISHLSQARSGLYSDWHPPLASFLLGHGALLAPWLPLLAHLTLVAGGSWLLARRIRPAWLALGALAVSLLVPPTWSIGTAIWKDVSTTCALLVCCAALSYRRPVASVVAAVLAAALRHNAILALPPLCLAAAGQLLPSARWPSRTLLALALTGLAALAPSAASRMLGARSESVGGAILLHDLAAIYRAHPADFAAPPSTLTGVVSAEDLARGYRTSGVNLLLWGDAYGFRVVPTRFFARHREALFAEWLREIARHPRTYVEHRLGVWAHLMNITPPESCNPFHDDIVPNEFGLRMTRHTLAFRLFDGWRHASTNSVLFRGWFWALLCVALAAAGWFLRSFAPLVGLTAASGLLYAAAYIPTAPCCDFRFLYWTVVAALASSLLLLAALWPRNANVERVQTSGLTPQG